MWVVCLDGRGKRKNLFNLAYGLQIHMLSLKESINCLIRANDFLAFGSLENKR